MKSLTLFLECFKNIQLLEYKKFKLFKKKSNFSGLRKTTKLLGGAGGTNKKIELHLSNPWKSLLGRSSKTQNSVGLI
jgi:hypothetical protein